MYMFTIVIADFSGQIRGFYQTKLLMYMFSMVIVSPAGCEAALFVARVVVISLIRLTLIIDKSLPPHSPTPFFFYLLLKYPK